MNLNPCLLVVASLMCVAPILAQTVSLGADAQVLSRRGGEVTLTATVNYEAAPSALGWSIDLPPSWTLVRVEGPDLPAVAPSPGTTGVLEFAFTRAPAGETRFAVVVGYPAGPGAAEVTAVALIRSGGKLIQRAPKPVVFTPGNSHAAGRSEK